MVGTLEPKVVLYLDVDGVLNAQMPPWLGTKRVSAAVTVTEGHTYIIRFSPALITALRALRVTLKWTTTWEDEAPWRLSSLFKWPESNSAKVLHPIGERDNEYSAKWKLGAVMADQRANPRPFIWVDDELGAPFICERYEVFESLDTLGVPYLVLGPKDFLGITPKMVNQMTDFITEQENSDKVVS